jgi:outer membrane protein W
MNSSCNDLAGQQPIGKDEQTKRNGIKTNTNNNDNTSLQFSFLFVDNTQWSITVSTITKQQQTQGKTSKQTN